MFRMLTVRMRRRIADVVVEAAEGLCRGRSVRDHGLGTVEKSAVPVITFHWPVSGVEATAPLASMG
jgi:hypothetical protein